MNERKWKKFFNSEIDKEMQEIDAILEEMNRDPKMKDVVAPESMHDNLMKKIDEYKQKQARLTEEEKNLIQLGKFYKRIGKWVKVAVLAVVMIGAIGTVGITSMGGPQKVIKIVSWFLGDKEKTNVDTDSDRVQEPDNVSEAEAYQKVEDEFGFYPVELVCVPNGMAFKEIDIDQNMQKILMIYQGTDDSMIAYTIYSNYRTSSAGIDVEDVLLNEYSKEVNGINLTVKEYLVEQNKEQRYSVTFEYQNAYYHLHISNVVKGEVEDIINNLYFPQN